jgi:hypothetical protein
MNHSSPGSFIKKSEIKKTNPLIKKNDITRVIVVERKDNLIKASKEFLSFLAIYSAPNFIRIVPKFKLKKD